MKILSVIRHAEASRDDAHLRDFDRPLTETGMRDAAHMGRELSRHRTGPALILTSPALRALTTAQLIAAELDLPAHSVLADDHLYHADASALLSVVEQLDDSVQHAAIVGHNPALLDVINLLNRAVLPELPAGAVVRLEFDADTWAGIQPRTGRLAAFLHP